jgi:hypothetical protein
MSHEPRWLVLVSIMGAFALLLACTIYAGAIDFSTSGMDGPHGTVSSMFTPLVMATIALGLATYKTCTGRLFAGNRWNSIDQELAHGGFRPATTAEVDETLRLHVQLLAPNVLAVDRGGGIDHVSIGSVADRQVRCFRAKLRGGRRWIDETVVAVRVPASFKPTMIRSTSRGVGPRRNMKRVRFEHERFNRSIEVSSVDRYFATALVDPRMMEWLRGNLARTTIELADGWVVAWSTSLQGPPRSPSELIELLMEFNARMPRAVPSLFPRSAATTFWRQRKKHASLSSWLDRLSHEGPKQPRA